MKEVLLTTFILILYTGKSQNEFATHWFIDEEVGLDWSAGNPEVQYAEGFYGWESNISYSDANGNLLFASTSGDVFQSGWDYRNVYNAQGEVMPSGALGQSLGCYSSAGGGVVIPDFNDPDIYHIFTIDCVEMLFAGPEIYTGLSKSKIDMSLDGGLGDIVQIDSIIYADTLYPFIESYAVTHDNTGLGYWIVAHNYLPYPINSPTDTFYVYHFDETGISGPFKQSVGIEQYGHIEISPDGNHLLFGKNLFQFDNSTGVISWKDSLDVSFVKHSSFSPDGNLLYTVDGYRLYQWQINDALINDTKTLIYEYPPSNYQVFHQLQITPNCEILSLPNVFSTLGKITNPNEPGLACNFVPEAVTDVPLPGYRSAPNFVESLFFCETANLSDEEQKIEAYYQPGFHTIQVNMPNFSTEVAFEILDIRGRVSQKGEIHSASEQIELNSLSNGIYLLRIAGWKSQLKFAVIN